ncbi:MAG: PAS domain-containing protein [Alphaproteobacteria bacterium]|nr:PAS domain-containing protein [Alphaproteobacteria bacterium]
MSELRHMRVLLVEDNAGDARLVQLALASETLVEFDVVHADCLAVAKERLAAGGIDAVLLDLSLPDSFGMNTVRAVMEAAPAVPIVVLTGLDDAKVGYDSVKEGAQDYLVKGHADGDQLRRAILYAEYRKASQLTIERLHHRHDQILSSLGEGVVGLDASGKTVFLNPEILRMTGLASDDVMGRFPQTAFREIDADGRLCLFEGSQIAKTLADGQVRHVSDVFLTSQDGTPIPVDYIVNPMRGQADGIEGAVVAYRDVSDRQQAFDVLRRQLDFHQRMIDAVALPLFYLDTECVILGCNLAFGKLVDKAPFAMLGQHAPDSLPVAIGGVLTGAMDKLLDGETVSLEILLDEMVLLTLAPITDAREELLGFVGALSRV